MAEKHILHTPLECPASGQGTVRQHPQGVDITRRTDRTSGDLLGGHIIGCADQRARGRQPRRGQLLGDAKIGQQHTWPLGSIAEKDIPRLNVPVDHSSRMGIVKRLCYRLKYLEQRFQSQCARFLKPVMQGSPGQQLHGDEDHPLVFTYVVDRHNMGMRQRGRGNGLAFETLHHGGVIAVVRIENLEGHIALQHRIDSAIDRGHPAPAKQLLDIIATETLMDEGAYHG